MERGYQMRWSVVVYYKIMNAECFGMPGYHCFDFFDNIIKRSLAENGVFRFIQQLYSSENNQAGDRRSYYGIEKAEAGKADYYRTYKYCKVERQSEKESIAEARRTSDLIFLPRLR